MKTIRKNFLLLAFAAGAFFLIGNNVLADPTTIIRLDLENCPGGFCTYSNAYGESCFACCPVGKDPHCNNFGCECR